MSVGCTQLLCYGWLVIVHRMLPPEDSGIQLCFQSPTGVWGMVARKLRGYLPGGARRAGTGLVEDVHVVGNGPIRVLHRAHAAPLAIHRAVLAPRPAGSRPVARAMHGGVGL